MKPNCILFDLDGTLVDTAPDFLEVLNKVLDLHHQTQTTLAELKPVASLGSKFVLSQIFKLPTDSEEFIKILNQFRNYYAAIEERQARLFAGTHLVLDYLTKNNIRWGVVTNNLSSFAQQILKHVKLDKSYQCLITADNHPQTKPHPAPLLSACEQLQCKPQETIYVGDSIYDAQAANAAEIPFWAVSYGYWPDRSTLLSTQHQHVITTPEDMITFIES